MFTQCRDMNGKLSEDITLFKLQLKLSSTISFGKQHFRRERCLRSEVWEGFWRLMAFWRITSSSCHCEQCSICQTFPVPEQARVVAMNLSHGLVQTQICSAKAGIEIAFYRNWSGGLNQTNAWGELLLSPFLVVASIIVPDSLGVIKHNEKLLLPMFFFFLLCLVLHSPL